MLLYQIWLLSISTTIDKVKLPVNLSLKIESELPYFVFWSSCGNAAVKLGRRYTH